MLLGLRLWWARKRTTPERDRDAVAGDTRQVAKAIAQTIANRELARPALAAADPATTARDQRAYDADTIERYRETIRPELCDLRAECIARGAWNETLETTYRAPESLADLRALVIALADARDALEAPAAD